MRILVTNDDGIDAPGIAVLAEIAAGLGEVWVVAPDRERSGVSHAITLFRPLRLDEVRPRWFSCSGTPTDCVYLAINQLEIGFDLVLSGINPGPNLAHDVLYSGTVSAALEGAHWGVPSIAISHCSGNTDWLPAISTVAAKSIRAVLPVAQRLKRAINVNLPPADRMPYAGIVATKLGHRVYSNEVHERQDPRGGSYYWIGGATVTMKDVAGSDCNAVRDNYVSVTPLGDNLTLHTEVPRLSEQLAKLSETSVGTAMNSADKASHGVAAIGFPFE